MEGGGEDGVDVPSAIKAGSHVFDAAFLGRDEVLASAHVTGAIKIWRRVEQGDTEARLPHPEYQHVKTLKSHTKSCRCLEFLPDSRALLSCSADASCAVTNEAGSVVWRCHPPEAVAVNALQVFDQNCFASGDDAGVIRVWDLRAPPSDPQLIEEAGEDDDCVLGFDYDQINRPHRLAATLGSTLQIIDTRRIKGTRASDCQEGDLLNCVIVKNGTRLVCGMGTRGSIALFDWTDIEKAESVFNHAGGVSVDCVLPYKTPRFSTNATNVTLITGSGDGLIRVQSVFPMQLLGSLGAHSEEEDPVEFLKIAPSGESILSGGHDARLRFHPTRTVDQLIEKFASSSGTRPLSSHAAPAPEDFFDDM